MTMNDILELRVLILDFKFGNEMTLHGRFGRQKGIPKLISLICIK